MKLSAADLRRIFMIKNHLKDSFSWLVSPFLIFQIQENDIFTLTRKEYSL